VLCVEDQFNVIEYNESENGYHEYSNVGEESEGGLRGHYQETEDYTHMSTYPSNLGDELLWEGYVEAMTLE
jgi:hypothetical protein